MLYPLLGVRKCWLSNFNRCCVINSPLTNNFRWVKEVNVLDNGKWLENIKKHQIIFTRKRFARDKTQSTQGLSIPFY